MTIIEKNNVTLQVKSWLKLNEKCARIREAFVGQFDEHFAKNYYIDGKRGEPKKISLPRELVKWE